ncbi:hypothetical protein SDRG_02413 [Saprolegnia diclina VS20]|uniref:Uncharacterized protein n=1 Tax=Saprolegnia diclina (strain VS20) TaxID=1156394 RepID=T0S614_SAPDV|nr:hypothetical protein SDRG_02413 [Saprolegnia diclina VS20]EQC40523.1 hypothetical protein SDRG_02413 [Saprolegnia diclina VS20]|eukprot:XP_008606222.1 hypothetical protein SDRG_02413 [Saprolegnia diclina VS20]
MASDDRVLCAVPRCARFAKVTGHCLRHAADQHTRTEGHQHQSLRREKNRDRMCSADTRRILRDRLRRRTRPISSQ